MSIFISASGDKGMILEIYRLQEKPCTLAGRRQVKRHRYPLAIVLLLMALAKLAGQDRPWGNA